MKIRLLLFASILALCLFSCQSENERDIPEKVDVVTLIDSLGARYFELNRFSGTILVAQSDSVIFSKNYGMADYENSQPFNNQTAFKVGELSELFTAQIIRQMAIASLVKEEDLVSKFIPEIMGSYTIGSLLKHESGLPSIASVKTENPDLPYATVEFAQLAKLDTLNLPKSDLGYNLLGLIIERVSKMSFQQAMNVYLDNIPLSNTYFEGEKQLAKGYAGFNNYRGQGLERQDAPVYDDKEAFSSSGIKATIKDVLAISRIQANPHYFGFLPTDGFSYYLHKEQETDLTIIVLSNYRHPVAEEIANSIGAILKEEAFQMPLLREVAEVDSNTLKKYAGTYALNPQMSFEVVSNQDSLFFIMGGNQVQVLPQSETQFFLKDTDASMKFMEDSTGKISGVMLLNGFTTSEQVANKIGQGGLE